MLAARNTLATQRCFCSAFAAICTRIAGPEVLNYTVLSRSHRSAAKNLKQNAPGTTRTLHTVQLHSSAHAASSHRCEAAHAIKRSTIAANRGLRCLIIRSAAATSRHRDRQTVASHTRRSSGQQPVGRATARQKHSPLRLVRACICATCRRTALKSVFLLRRLAPL